APERDALGALREAGSQITHRVVAALDGLRDRRRAGAVFGALRRARRSGTRRRVREHGCPQEEEDHAQHGSFDAPVAPRFVPPPRGTSHSASIGRTKTSRGLVPIWGPTTPSASICSIMRAARL